MAEKNVVKVSDLSSFKQITSVMEGNERRLQATMTASNVTTPESIVLCTIRVVRRNGNRSLKVNASLDDAGMKTCVNADRCRSWPESKSERLKVRVLNGQVETSKRDQRKINWKS